MKNLSQFLPIKKHCIQVCPRWLSGKATNARDVGSIPGSGRVPGEGHANPLPGKSCRQRSLTGYSPWAHKNLDATEHAHMYNNYFHRISTV